MSFYMGRETIKRMRDSKDEILRQLDAVVGDSYDPPRRWKAAVLKWLAFAALAVVASVVIVGILDTHVMKAQKDAAQKRPVPVHLIPPK